MECYGKGDLSWTDVITENTIDSFIQEWGTDDLIDLLGECEFVLSYNAGRIDQLKAKGLKRLYHIVTGINRKNEQIVRDNTQSIQDISLKIQKILLKRIDSVSYAYLNLNEKVNTEIFWTRDVVKKLLQKLKSVSAKADLTAWQVNVRNRRMKNGSKYIEASDGVKILLVVSDIFQIVRCQIDLVDDPCLETALNDQLEIPEQIKVSDFYRDIINDKDCLTLYVKEGYPYLEGDLSDYGRMICQISDFYLDDHIKVLAQKYDRTIKDMCMDAYGRISPEEDKTISPSGLCRRLLGDLADLEDRHQAEAEEKILREPVEEKTSSESAEVPEKRYSVLRIMPEVCRLFRAGADNTNELSSRKGGFKDIQSIKAYISEVKPCLLAAPKKCIADYANIFPKETKCISLSDYYMYLWFAGKEKSERTDRMVAFIEHYDGRLYYSRYVVKDPGDRYEKIYGGKKDMHDARTGNHVVKDVKEGFETTGKKDIEIYMTFTDDTINERLERHNVKMADDKWEKCLKTGNDTLGVIIHDMIEKSKYKGNQQSIECD